MKHTLSLKDRYDFTWKDYRKELTLNEDGSWTMVLFTQEAEDWRNLSPIMLRMKYNNNLYAESAIVIQYKSNGDLFFGQYYKPLAFGNGRIFPKKEWRSVIKTENGKVRTGNIDYFTERFINCFLHFVGAECITDNYNGDGLILEAITKKPILKGLITGKITNRKAVIKTFMASSYKVTKFEYDAVETYFKCKKCIYDMPHFGKLIRYTNDWQKAVRRLAQSTDEERKLFRDLLKDAFYLDRKFNQSWSLARMKEEHQKNIGTIFLLQQGSLSDKPLYESAPVIDTDELQGKVLSTEREVFEEAHYMHHCLHSHYFSDIRQKRYIAISFSVPERITVGLSVYDENEYTSIKVDQMHTRFDRAVKPEHQKLILEYIRKYQDTLTTLVDADGYEDTYEVQIPYTPPQPTKTKKIKYKFYRYISLLKKCYSVLKGESYTMPYIQPVQDVAEDLPFN